MESETLNAEIDRLLFKIKAGDADAFCSFVDATKRPLALSALAYLKNADDIEDALQETYISILVHIDGYCSLRRMTRRLTSFLSIFIKNNRVLP